MRVHPSVVRSSGARWHFPVAVLLLLAVLVSNVFKGARNSATASTQEKMVRVIIATAPIEQGKAIDIDQLKFQSRPASQVPPDAVTDPNQLKDKFAASPILPGYPLATPLISDKAETKKSGGPGKAEPDPETVRIQEKLNEINKDTIGLTLNFLNPPPPKGTRIAIAIQGKTGSSQIVADEAWVETVNDKMSATVRVKNRTALLLNDARTLGNFSYFSIPEQGESPFAKDVVSDLMVLREHLLPASTPTKHQASTTAPGKKTKKAGDFSSYAWVSGEGVKYSIDENGKLFVIDDTGIVSPLYGAKGPDTDVASQVAEPEQNNQPIAVGTSVEEKFGFSEKPPRQPGEIRTGLEAIFPNSKIEPVH